MNCADNTSYGTKTVQKVKPVKMVRLKNGAKIKKETYDRLKEVHDSNRIFGKDIARMFLRLHSKF